jgi:hypothetical protein
MTLNEAIEALEKARLEVGGEAELLMADGLHVVKFDVMEEESFQLPDGTDGHQDACVYVCDSPQPGKEETPGEVVKRIADDLRELDDLDDKIKEATEGVVEEHCRQVERLASQLEFCLEQGGLDVPDELLQKAHEALGRLEEVSGDASIRHAEGNPGAEDVDRTVRSAAEALETIWETV